MKKLIMALLAVACTLSLLGLSSCSQDNEGLTGMSGEQLELPGIKQVTFEQLPEPLQDRLLLYVARDTLDVGIGVYKVNYEGKRYLVLHSILSSSVVPQSKDVFDEKGIPVELSWKERYALGAQDDNPFAREFLYFLTYEEAKRLYPMAVAKYGTDVKWEDVYDPIMTLEESLQLMDPPMTLEEYLKQYGPKDE